MKYNLNQVNTVKFNFTDLGKSTPPKTQSEGDKIFNNRY